MVRIRRSRSAKPAPVIGITVKNTSKGPLTINIGSGGGTLYMMPKEKAFVYNEQINREVQSLLKQKHLKKVK